MSLNALNTNSHLHDMAAAQTQYAATDMAKLDDKKQADKTLDKSIIEKLISSKKEQAGAQRQMVSDLVSKLAGSGVSLNDNLTGKVQNKIKDEYDMMFKSEGEEKEDAATLSLQTTVRRKNNQNGNGNKNDGGEQPMPQSEKVAPLVKEYGALYSQFLLTGGSELKKKIEALEKALKEEGVTAKDLLSIQNTVSKSIRQEITSQIKEMYLKRVMSPENSIEFSMNTRGLNNLLDQSFANQKLGGWDFGGHLGNLQNALNEKATEVKEELRSFVKEEIEQKSVQRVLHDNVDPKEFNEILKLGSKVGFNPHDFLNTWGQKVVDLGLTPAPFQGNIGNGTNTDLNENNNKNKDQNTGYEFSKDDEKDLMVNQLRALYMKRAVKGGLRSIVETTFKIRKLKSGLIRLGVNFGDLEKVEKEGMAIGRMKLIEMLQEAFYERATLYDLSSGAYALVESKIRGVMKNLEKLGFSVSKPELDSMRDEANKRMLDVTESELKHDKAVFESNSDPRLGKKLKMLTKLVKRLSEESKILVDTKQIEDIAFIRSQA
ncbi:hypothetical protein HZC34_01840 [Candidatus Saganbacteria bacterium]|nr:hypothetical protein [Candidatus Saganbacteria bacterium]